MAALIFTYAPMNSGKSTSLLQTAHNYRARGFTPILFTAAVDTRFGAASVVSRLGVRSKAHTFSKATDFAEFIEGCLQNTADPCQKLALFIDEAQFLTREQARVLHITAHILDIPVLCFGIRSDFTGSPFPGTTELLGLADRIDVLHSVCACGADASMHVLIKNGRRVTAGNPVMIGDEEYIVVCSDCFYNVSDEDLIARLPTYAKPECPL